MFLSLVRCATMRIVGRCIIGGIILVLLASFVDPAIVQFREFSWTSHELSIACACLLPIIGFTLAALFLIFRSKDEKTIARIVFSVLLISFLARLGWVLAFGSYQMNDFGDYLQCAADVAVNGDPAQSVHCRNADSLYWRRSAFYTYPLVLLFGQSLLALKIVNICLASFSGLFFYLAGRNLFGARTAAIGLLFFIWHPDLWYSVTLASHDVPGMFWLSIFFYCSIILHRRLLDRNRSHAAILALSVATGIVVFLAGMTRSYQHGALISLGGCALIHAVFLLVSKEREGNEIVRSIQAERPHGIWLRTRTAVIHLVFLLAVPYLTYSAGERIFRAVWPPSPLKELDPGIICNASIMNVLGENCYEEIAPWLSECALLPENVKTGFAVRKIAHDISHDPGRFLLHLVHKNRSLSRADDYLFWAGSKEREPWDATFRQVKRINSSYLSEQSMALYLVHIALMLLVSWRLLLYPSLPFQLVELIPLLFSAAYFVLFLVFHESQGRYEIFLIFIFSWMAGQAIVDIYERIVAPVQKPARIDSRRWMVFAGGALFVALSVGAFWGAASAIAGSSFALRDQSGFKSIPPPKAPGFAEGRSISPVFVENNHKRIILAYPTGATLEPGTIAAVEKSFANRPARRHFLRFFLSTEVVQREPFYFKIPWDDQTIEYLVLANGHLIAQGKVREIPGNRYVSVEAGPGFEFGQSMSLQLILRNASRIDRVEPDRGPIIALEYIDLR
jgi:hypothetical protein